jgi:lipopolysaccharide transport system permease protein
MPESSNSKWDWEITAKSGWWGATPRELWAYRFLLRGLVRSEFLRGYQQTVLGPLWLLLQPVMTTATYLLVFGKLVGISTGAVPPTLFYLAGIVLWNLFNDAFTGTSSIFRDNAHLFSKVYFPRLVVPFAQLSSHLISFGIQFLFLLMLLVYYRLFTGWESHTLLWLLVVPLVVGLVCAQSLALGLIFSVLTGKYRDVKFVVGLGVRLLMFLTPVIYPLQYVTEKWRWLTQLNPLTPLFELFRWLLLGEGIVTTGQLLCTMGFTLILFFAALLTFNKQGDKIIDVV